MDFAQERVTTLHAVSGADRVPRAPTDRTAVLVPMAARDGVPDGGFDRVIGALETVGPQRVVVALRADRQNTRAIADRLADVSIPLELLWCNGPRVREALEAGGIDGPVGKGHDVWVGLALATRSPFVAVHDADTASYTEAYVPRLVAPLADRFDRTTGISGTDDRRASAKRGYEFTKGYYARIEGGRLYGRLCRLLYAPLVRALASRHDAAILPYLDSFRYGLAGEFAMTADLAREVRLRPQWGLEVGLLGETRRVAGADRTAQVDLGVHDHDHRSVEGAAGLSTMAHTVTEGLLEVVENGGVEPDYADLTERYCEHAAALVEAYRADAAFNGLAYDAIAEREQIATYAESISPPKTNVRLPAWNEAAIDPKAVCEAARADLADVLDSTDRMERVSGARK